MQRLFEIDTDDDEVKTEPILFKRILFVENDPEIIREAQDALDTHFFDVTVAHNGVAAVRELLRSDFDLIVCDLAMPGFPGEMFFEAVSRVKPQLCKRFISIVDLGNRKASHRSLGAISIWKPLDVQMLLEAIETVLKKSQRMAADVQRRKAA
jgi:DNA-binding response OmpR family regulator